MAKKGGLFITFEGGEGVGKTTQIARLAKAFASTGREVVVTREPGGSAIANRMRALIIDPKNDGMVPLAELFLYEASRAQHMHDTVLPALRRKAIVICDRFADSSLVYQGVGRKLPPKTVVQLNKLATGGVGPDATILLDLDPRIGLARVGARGVLDRLEREKLSFHRAVRSGFLKLAKQEKRRFFVVSASNSRDEIHALIVAHMERRGWL